jgi:hypothetical protein
MTFVMGGWRLAIPKSGLTKWIGLNDSKISALMAGFALRIESSASTSALSSVFQSETKEKKRKCEERRETMEEI